MKVISFKGQVVHRKDRSKHVGRTGKWSEVETRTLDERLADKSLTRDDVIRLTMKETGRSDMSVRHKIYERTGVKKANRTLTPGPPAPLKGGIDSASPVELLFATLPGRVKFDAHDYFLDGKRSSFYRCVKEANRVRKERGEKQIVGSPEWIV